MPGPYVVPVHGDTELPKEVDVVVIGGGIIGTSTALELSERGLRVALCEKGESARSSRAATGAGYAFPGVTRARYR